MEKLEAKLKNPFDGLSTENDVNRVCREIAKELFGQYCIKCLDEEYYFAEVEFYYWQKDRWEKEWNRVTYPRDGYEAGQLFFHMSGVDICFDSSFKDAKFGGILIRAIMDHEGNVIAGPLNSMLYLLNACKGGEMPKLEKLQAHKHEVKLKSTYRALGEKDKEKEKSSKLSLCFYDALPKEKWIAHKIRFNKLKGVQTPQNLSYKTDRFDL